MKPKIFIDGQEGTTGLQIYERLGARDDIELLLIDESKRKDVSERRRLLNSADLVFLCLPDAAAREAVSLIENDTTRVIDASTAHRTAPNWAYGFPELSGEHRAAIEVSKRVANPGCHATGFLSTVYPLIKMGILPASYRLTCFSLTGYSGGGKKMIAEYEGKDKGEALFAPRLYGLNLDHKHMPEMMAVTGLERKPIFVPIVDDYYKGMSTSVTVHNDLLPEKFTAAEIRDRLAQYYGDNMFITVAPFRDGGFLESNWGGGTNRLEITVSGGDGMTLLTARFDNLGKGASGAAVQNMNIMLGFDEGAGLK
jgi:N-acetyl-gamma-glutamyl-phosphate reductase